MSVPYFLKNIPPGVYDDITYLTRKDDLYNEAIEMLNKSNEISIFPVMIPFSKPEILSLLLISTENFVFIFDILAYGNQKVPEEFSKIFLSKKKKIVFDKNRTFSRLGFNTAEINVPHIVDIKMLDYLYNLIRNPGQNPNRKLLHCMEECFPQAKTWIDISALLVFVNWIDRPLLQMQHMKIGRFASFLLPTCKVLEDKLTDCLS
ncbi:uncharacterized protein [Onthophagus taurus]|uniref:uncharacterized protein n=1 Tax=Onthophagus taurus TaxID=166361 RepID=UPI000C20DF25|nr:uncharacterized protein LOC111416326 [Onthophagus taurus]